MRIVIAVLGLLALATACASDEDVEGRGRGHVEKGDLFGSCRSSQQDTACGSVASGGNCWCDDTCTKFGDCCLDRNPICGEPKPSQCDGLNSEKCGDMPGCKTVLVPACPLCDGGQLVCVADAPCEGLDEAACSANPKCAMELVPACPTCDGGTIQCVAVEVPGEATRCGGLAGLQCDSGFWCDFDESSGGVCGIADQPGICRPKPEACLQVFQPVCGCDGVTHGNACVANQNGVDAAAEGACATN